MRWDSDFDCFWVFDPNLGDAETSRVNAMIGNWYRVLTYIRIESLTSTIIVLVGRQLFMSRYKTVFS